MVGSIKEDTYMNKRFHSSSLVHDNSAIRRVIGWWPRAAAVSAVHRSQQCCWSIDFIEKYEGFYAPFINIFKAVCYVSKEFGQSVFSTTWIGSFLE